MARFLSISAVIKHWLHLVIHLVWQTILLCVNFQKVLYFARELLTGREKRIIISL